MLSFQYRTRHVPGCNGVATRITGSNPWFQYRTRLQLLQKVVTALGGKFQYRTRHVPGCNSVTCICCPA